MNTSLTYETLSTTPNFNNCGFCFFVESGKLFDADDYAEAFNLNRSEIDDQRIKATQDEAAKLNDGEWLKVTHENE